MYLDSCSSLCNVSVASSRCMIVSCTMPVFGWLGIEYRLELPDHFLFFIRLEKKSLVLEYELTRFMFRHYHRLNRLPLNLVWETFISMVKSGRPNIVNFILTFKGMVYSVLNRVLFAFYGTTDFRVICIDRRW